MASAPACSATRAPHARIGRSAPLVLNPQGLEEFGATDPSRAPLKRAAYLPLRRAVLACARGGRRGDRDRPRARAGRAAAPRHPARADADDSQRARSAAPRRARPIRRWSRELRRRTDVAARRGRSAQRRAAGGEQRLPRPAARARGRARPRRRSTERRGAGSVLGDGPYRRASSGWSPRELGLATRVRFLGRVSDRRAARVARGWRRCSSIPTLYEGSSLVTLEAMAPSPRGRRVERAGGCPTRCDRASTAGSCRPATPVGARGGDQRRALGPGAPRTLRPRRPRDRRARVLVAAAGDRTVALYRELLGSRVAFFVDEGHGPRVARSRRSAPVAPRARAGPARGGVAAVLGAAVTACRTRSASTNRKSWTARSA